MCASVSAACSSDIEEGGRLAGVVRRGTGGGAFVVAGEFVEGPLPAVAFVFDEALEHGDGDGFGAFCGEADVAEEGRDAGEVRDLGEEAADLGVGIFAGLEAAKELHDELGVVEDRGVGLLGRAGACREWADATGCGEGGAFVALK